LGNPLDLIEIFIPGIDLRYLFGLHVNSVVSIGKGNIFANVKIKSPRVEALILKVKTS